MRMRLKLTIWHSVSLLSSYSSNSFQCLIIDEGRADRVVSGTGPWTNPDSATDLQYDHEEGTSSLYASVPTHIKNGRI